MLHCAVGFAYLGSKETNEDEEVSSLELQPVLMPKVTRSYPSSVTGQQRAEDDAKSAAKTVSVIVVRELLCMTG